MIDTLEKTKSVAVEVENLLEALSKPERSKIETSDRLRRLGLVSEQLRELAEISRDEAEALRHMSLVMRRCLTLRTSIPH